MLGRQVGTSLLRLPHRARLPIRSLPAHHPQPRPHDVALRTLVSSAHRSYADPTPRRPGRPKKAVGEPSRPVKRAVKRAAKSPKEDAATKKVKANQETAAKKKKAVATPKKKALTEEQKAKKAETAAKRKASQAKKLQAANLVELKSMALRPPPVHKNSAWMMFSREKQRAADYQGLDFAAMKDTFGQRQKEIARDFRNITAAELEHYNHLAHSTREGQRAAYKQYVESHTIEEIAAANRARRSLRIKLKGKPAEVKKWPGITDERAVKRPIPAYSQFLTNRYASGDFKHIKLIDAAKLISQEWKALSEDEKKKYQKLYNQDTERYKDEYTTVHGHAPPTVHTIPAPAEQAAAAAA